MGPWLGALGVDGPRTARRSVEGTGALWVWYPRGPGAGPPQPPRGSSRFGGSEVARGRATCGGQDATPLPRSGVGCWGLTLPCAARSPFPLPDWCVILSCLSSGVKRSVFVFFLSFEKTAFWIRVSFLQLPPCSVSFVHSALAPHLPGSVFLFLFLLHVCYISVFLLTLVGILQAVLSIFNS